MDSVLSVFINLCDRMLKLAFTRRCFVEIDCNTFCCCLSSFTYSIACHRLRSMFDNQT